MSQRVGGLKVRTWLALAAVLALLGVWAAGSIAKDAADGKSPTPATVTTGEATNYAKTLSKAFRDTADKVLPSVVAIHTRPTMAAASAKNNPTADEEDDDPMGELFRRNPELRRFFRDLPSAPESPRRGVSGVGSGVIIDSAGVILTNNHVVEGGGRITVKLQDGREFEATDVRTDPKTDIAVLRIKADNLQAAKLGDSDKMAVGDWVLALGDPFGLEGTVTAGIVSAKGRAMGLAQRENWIQTDAAINPGNSGGPLVNLDGEVIGINTAISTRSGGNQGVGFAVPSNIAHWVSEQLLASGKVKRAYLGVAIQAVNQDLAQQLGVKVHEGVLVSSVQPNTPAAKAGLKAGDVILDFNGASVATPNELQGAVEQAKIGSSVPMIVLRDGKRVTLNVAAEEQPKNFGLARGSVREEREPRSEGSKFEKLGIEVSDLTDSVAEKLGVKSGEGVVITRVLPDSPAAEAGLASGTVITQANRQPVKSVADLEKAITRSGDKGVLLLVRDNEASRFVVIRPEK